MLLKPQAATNQHPNSHSKVSSPDPRCTWRHRELEVDGKKYATLMPADTPVILAGYETVPSPPFPPTILCALKCMVGIPLLLRRGSACMDSESFPQRVQVNGTDQLMPILDDDEIDKLFDTAVRIPPQPPLLPLNCKRCLVLAAACSL